MSRTIESPGVVIKEGDLSLRTVTPVGTKVLVHGFASQGPTNELILVSTKQELNQLFFGGKEPTNAAERYFYGSCNEVLNSPATLYITRLPYGSGDGIGFDGDYTILAFPLIAQALSTTITVYLSDREFLADFSFDKYFSLSNYTMIQSTISAGGFLNTLGIPEIGTTTYDPINHSVLMIANNENTQIKLYQINPNDISATYVSSWPMEAGGGTKFHDVEGMCWVRDDVFAVVEERLNTEGTNTVNYQIPITYFNLPTVNEELIAKTTCPQILANLDVPYGANRGPEGITYDSQENAFYVCIEGRYGSTSDHATSVTGIPLNQQPRIVKLDLNDTGFTVNGLVSTYPSSATTDLFPVVQMVSSLFLWTTPPVYFDFSDLYFDYKTRTLYTITDRASGVIHTDLSGNIINFYSLSSYSGNIQSEGIAFSHDMSAMFISSEPRSMIRLNFNPIITQSDDFTYSTMLTCLPVSAGTVFCNISTNIGSYALYDYLYDGVLSSIQTPLLTGFVDYNSGYLTIDFNHLGINSIVAAITGKSQCYTTPITSYSYYDIPYSLTDSLSIGEPYVVPITESEYNNLQTGTINWATTGGHCDTFETLGNACFLLINKAKTTIDENYEGYYVGIADNSGITEGTYNCITEIKTLTSDNTKITLNNNLLVFPLTGDTTNISKSIETSYNYDFTDTAYNDTLLLNLFRIRSDESAIYPNKLDFIPVENYIGSLEATDQRVDNTTREIQTFYLADKVNQSSNYLQMIMNNTISNYTINHVKNLSTKLYPIGSYLPSKKVSDTSLKHIGNVPQKISRALLLAENVRNVEIDITIGSGLETIWAYVAENDGMQSFDDSKNISSHLAELCDVNTGSQSLFAEYHNTIFNLYNNFCSNIRKDCIHYSDPLRCIFVQGENTKTLDRKDRNFTSHIFTPLKNLYSAANSNYSATYANWVNVYDNTSSKYVWMPFSGWQSAITARMDASLRPWYAPFGLNNGIIPNISNIALKTNQHQQDALYRIGINPVVYFSRDGYVVWGQKTLQNMPSPFDRLNVRRLFIALERSTLKVLRYFIGEPNNLLTRTRVHNVLVPIYDLAMNNEGCYNFNIVCDESNNTQTVIENNEMRVNIYIQPVRTAEFILVTFYATRTDQNFSEII